MDAEALEKQFAISKHWTTLDECVFIQMLSPEHLRGYAAAFPLRVNWDDLDRKKIKMEVNKALKKVKA